mmetsp:Transcript_96399/g.201405  ORF Transcript_96399/g.201405 Transcript_96399/m.201405 type:complete len:88 (+) Transcript_96399:474-737(+)
MVVVTGPVATGEETAGGMCFTSCPLCVLLGTDSEAWLLDGVERSCSSSSMACELLRAGGIAAWLATTTWELGAAGTEDPWKAKAFNF